MNALYWFIIFTLGLVAAGIVSNIVEGVAKFHREGMERVRKLDR